MLFFEGSAPLAEFTEGSFIEVCPTACVSPHLFYCQIATADHKGKLGQLMDQMQDHYEGLGEQEQGIAGPTVGLNCAAVFAGQFLKAEGFRALSNMIFLSYQIHKSGIDMQF